MLVNNFKPLLFFGGGGTVKDVSGTTENVYNILKGAFESNTIMNGYQINGTVRSFNYAPTTATNSFVDEQTAYRYYNIVSSYGGYSTEQANISNSGFTRLYNGFILFLGTGETEVTAEDYRLATPITLNVTAAFCITNANGVVTVSRTFENNTGSDVTVKEIGLYLFRQMNSGNTSYPVMIGRKVLESPVTIPDGEMKTFEYVIDMNHISFSEADS